MPWQNPPDVATKKRGRGTREEEAHAYLRSVGIDPHSVLDNIRSIEVPESDEEYFQKFRELLYIRAATDELSDTALVNGLKAIATMAEAAAARQQDEDVIRDVDVILADAGLPAARRVEIGRGEIERLRARVAGLEMLVAQLEGEPA